MQSSTVILALYDASQEGKFIINPTMGVMSVEFYACLRRLPDLVECSNNTM
jgi:hypothetical protein